MRADRRRATRARPVAAAVLVLALGLAATPAPGPAAGRGTWSRATHAGRSYALFVPADATPGAELPLVVALHGCFQTPEDFALGTRLNRIAEDRGLLVVYPAQGPRDNPSRCWNWFLEAEQSRERGEVAQVLGIVERVREAWPAARPVIALGFSAGAFMAVNLACAAPDVIARIGVASGGPYRCGLGVDGGLACMRGLGLDGERSAAACRSAMGARARPIRASLWHGDGDSVVSAANLDALSVMLARVDAALAGPPSLRDGASHSTARDDAGEAVVERWLVPGMGHSWSGGDSRGSHTYPAGPDATERMLDFLLPP